MADHTISSSSVREYYENYSPKDNVIGEIKTFTGKYVFPMRMVPAMVCIEDIAHALARECRFAGHCHGFLSVAEHSMAVAAIVAETHPEFALEALLHDASEAYLGDMPRPIKHLPEMAPYREAEERAERAIAEVFGLTYPWPDVVKQADRTRLYHEMDNMWGVSVGHRGGSANHGATERLFLIKFETLMADRKVD